LLPGPDRTGSYSAESAWQHRQKGQKDCRHGHAEHIAEVRTRSHQQILHYVAEGLAPFDDAFSQGGGNGAGGQQDDCEWIFQSLTRDIKQQL
jgi:hypothetical protein